MRTRSARAAITVAVGIAVAAVGIVWAWYGSAGPAGAATPHRPSEQSIVVFAASSLTEVADQIADAVRQEAPGADITMVYAGSSDLASQLLEGAPADIFLSANERQADAVVDGLGLATPEVFATNTLTIAVPAGNPAHVTGLADLENGAVSTVVCAPQVPCGAATAQVARRQGVTLTPVSEESSVTDVLGKVSSGQADAGVVYLTDIARAQNVDQVAIDGAQAVVNRYVAVTVSDGTNAELAALYLNFLTGPRGQAILADAGFGTP